ncbi:aldo/keto reductase [Streptosporangium sandarakinum]|uniref:aldo/keto reductase n=1 Tax=Streptosporangium sandarakinum TaxID=1260955 RepID=UPI0033AD7601
MEQRTLGAAVCVGAVGLGRAGMSGAYGHSTDERSATTLRGALDAGITFIDTAGIYRPARLDPAVAIEETAGAVAEMVQKGHVRGIGLSEVGAETVDAAGLQLTEDDLDAIEQAVPRGAVAGERHAPALLALLDSERTGGEH